MSFDVGTIDEILSSDMSDGAKLAAIAALCHPHARRRDLATICNRPERTFQRHYAEMRQRKSAPLSAQNCAIDSADVRHDTAQNCAIGEGAPPKKKGLPHTPSKEKQPPTTESPSEISYSQNQDSPKPPKGASGRSFWANQFEQYTDPGIQFADGKLTLINGTRADWESRLGADQLDLALIEIAAELQPNSPTPIHLQVARKLARMARDKIDRDQRYKAAAAQNRPKASSPINPHAPVSRWG